MAVTTAVLSGNIADLGLDITPNYLSRVVLVIEANTPGSLLIDTAGNRHLAGAKRVSVDKTTGAYSVTLVTTNSADVVPTTGRLYRAALIYPSGTPGTGNVTQVSGWFQLTTEASLADIWTGLATTSIATSDYENITDSLMAGIDSNSASDFRVQQDARNDVRYPRRSDALVDRLTVGPDASVSRTGVFTHVDIDATTPGDTFEHLGHLFRSDVLGDFTPTTSPNDGWAWGINAYTHTPPGVGNGAGLVYLTGMLCEVSLGGDDFTGTAWGMVAEAAYIGASAGGTADVMASMKVANPKRKDGAVAGNANYVYGLYVDAVAPGSLGSIEAYSLYVAGGKSYFAGDVTITGYLGVPASAGIYVGDRLLDDDGTQLVINSFVNATGLYATGDVWADNFKDSTGSGCTLTWGAGAPTSTPPNGSLYLRTDGAAATTLYVRAAGAWVAK